MRSIRCVSFMLALLTITATIVFAGGPLALREPGEPFLWPDGGRDIPFNPDLGGLGPLSNAEAVALTEAGFGVWEDVATATPTYVNAGPLPVDVDVTNFAAFFAAGDGISPIVFDEDGSIFALLFGAGSGVIAFAGPQAADDAGNITEGQAFFNGVFAFFLSPADLLAVFVHEFGHYNNLAHTVVNGQAIVFGDTSGPTPFNTFGSPALTDVETMYPFMIVGGDGSTLHRDDIAIFSTLYPEDDFFSTTGTITGTILAPNDTTPLTGINVIARNIADPFADAVSAISSDFTDNFTPGAPFVGVYTINGLTPGASYAVYVDQILAGGFSTPPRSLPGPEEFYNGASESSDGSTDDPSVFVAVTTSTASGIDIIFNVPPGPIPLGDDTSFELFLNFTYQFCGQSFDSLFVNSNGHITFGVGDTDSSESTVEHLGGPPRIAGLWDDLNPTAGGVVSFSQDDRQISVTFEDVPEFFATGSNTFTITLERRGRFSVEYGDLDAADGLAGYSCGALITSALEQESDLSDSRRRIRTRDESAIFERFTASDNDLANLSLEFDRTSRRFEDREDRGRGNNSIRRATRVKKLPFNTADEFTDVNPDDVDYYRFRAREGEIIVVETVPGNQFDTLIGLFQIDGRDATLLALDDDGGFGGIAALSRLAIIAPEDSDYAVAVTTFPDFGFTGAGGDTGRYVLNINTYTGTLLALGDDATALVPLGFDFPFQGVDWSSVWVNSNGNLTFGVGDTDFTESVPELLGGPPRIAPLWDDLNPVSGLVIVDDSRRDRLTVHFATVPEFASTRPNYFSVELRRNGEVRVDWLATARSDGLVGVTEGGGVGDPGPTDLSEARRLSSSGTTYEDFDAPFGDFSNFDLFFDDRRFSDDD